MTSINNQQGGETDTDRDQEASSLQPMTAVSLLSSEVNSEVNYLTAIKHIQIYIYACVCAIIRVNVTNKGFAY